MYKCAYAFVARGNINKLVIILRHGAIVDDDQRILISIATRVTDLISVVATREVMEKPNTDKTSPAGKDYRG